MKPIHSFLILLGIGCLSVITMILFPESGLQVHQEITLQFPGVDDIFEELNPAVDSSDQDFDLEQHLAELIKPDSPEVIVDSLTIDTIAKEIDLKKYLSGHTENHHLGKFFSALRSIDELKKIRILHFGDSQIESDRISGYVRNEFQKEFGGQGCGLLPIYTTIPIFSMVYESDQEWQRYSVFGKKNSNLNHNRFGLDGAFSRFSDITPDSLITDSLIHTASVSYSKNKKSYHRNSQYKKAILYHGYNQRPCVLKSYVNDHLLRTDTLVSSTNLSSLEFNFSETPQNIKFEFSGADSPDFYGLSFESEKGIYLDNLAMRGCSGTVFRKMNRDVLGSMTNDDHIALIILQYGGNAIPFLKDSIGVVDYANWFKSQIHHLRNLYPTSSFMIIGPSDMAVKKDGKMVTRPFVIEVNQAMKRIAEESNCAFWDLYEAMGGKNSMKAWVEADPPLAAKDYTHFSSKGARKIGELLYQSIIDEYKLWLENEEDI